MLIEIAGYLLLTLFALALTLAWPLSEFARGMASNPSAHPTSRGGCLVSLAGLALLAAIIWDVFF